MSTMTDAQEAWTSIPGITVTVDESAIRVTSDKPLTVLSSAMIGGGLTEAHSIVNMRVEDVPPDARPADELGAFAASLGIKGSFIGLMTAAKTEHGRLIEFTNGGLTVAAIVSVGLSNRVCAGMTLPAAAAPGTINAIVIINAALTPAALVNAVITTTEAKTSALASVDVRTTDDLPASGTSTEAVVVACMGRGAPLDYAGPGPTVGWLTARAVRQAIERICHEQIARDGGRRVGW